jgi:hypothetical protein
VCVFLSLSLCHKPSFRILDAYLSPRIPKQEAREGKKEIEKWAQADKRFVSEDADGQTNRACDPQTSPRCDNMRTWSWRYFPQHSRFRPAPPIRWPSRRAKQNCSSRFSTRTGNKTKPRHTTPHHTTSHETKKERTFRRLLCKVPTPPLFRRRLLCKVDCFVFYIKMEGGARLVCCC